MLCLKNINKGSEDFNSARELIMAYSHAEKVPLYDLICRTPERVALFGVYESGRFCGCSYLLRHDNVALAYYLTFEKHDAAYRIEAALRELLAAQYPHDRIILDMNSVPRQAFPPAAHD